MLLFFLGMFAGLSWMIPFVIGLKGKENLDATGSILGRVKYHEPVIRTDEQEAELEEMLEAHAQR